ncbi:MAG: hypothetical protein J3K34DRAFT_188958 [Monoraphidium minutum]|nr:MAG: hypothetical protein J3K34DRAFT_188958 [Monoraphidium minutum]
MAARAGSAGPCVGGRRATAGLQEVVCSLGVRPGDSQAPLERRFLESRFALRAGAAAGSREWRVRVMVSGHSGLKGPAARRGAARRAAPPRPEVAVAHAPAPGRGGAGRGIATAVWRQAPAGGGGAPRAQAPPPKVHAGGRGGARAPTRFSSDSGSRV